MSYLLKAENIFYSSDEILADKKKSSKIILDNISLEIDKGRITGIAGESGSGKTTLVKILAGVIKPVSGKIIFDFISEFKVRTNPVQVLFQNNGEILNPYRPINKIVEEAITIENGKKTNAAAEKKRIFNSVNFSAHLWDRKGFELSGGEQQRAALARILAVNPELLILDEPFSAQDPESQLNLMNLFKKINTDFGLTMICVAHNLQLLKNLTDEVFILYKGKIVERGETKKIFNNPEHPYTKFLIKAEGYNLTHDELKMNYSND